MTGDADGAAGEDSTGEGPTGEDSTGAGPAGEDSTAARPTGARSGESDDGPVPASQADVASLRSDVEALEETLDSLRDELVAADRTPRLRPPRLRDLRRFTTEVTIPMTILVLETNVRMLRILQRALRAADGEADGRTERATRVGRRAADVSRRTLGRLEGVLADLQASVRADDTDDALPGLLEEAATLQERVQTELDRLEAAGDGGETGEAAAGHALETGGEAGADAGVDAEPVAVDVDAELESIKEQISDEDGDADR